MRRRSKCNRFMGLITQNPQRQINCSNKHSFVFSYILYKIKIQDFLNFLDSSMKCQPTFSPLLLGSGKSMSKFGPLVFGGACSVTNPTGLFGGIDSDIRSVRSISQVMRVKNRKSKNSKALYMLIFTSSLGTIRIC